MNEIVTFFWLTSSVASTSFRTKFKFLTRVQKALSDDFFLILHSFSLLLIAILLFFFFRPPPWKNKDLCSIQAFTLVLRWLCFSCSCSLVLDYPQPWIREQRSSSERLSLTTFLNSLFPFARLLTWIIFILTLMTIWNYLDFFIFWIL